MKKDGGAPVLHDLDTLAEDILSKSGDSYRRAAMTLSICLTAQPDELHSLVTEVWPGNDMEAAAAIERLLAAPFVEETAAGWRLNSMLAPRIALHFMYNDPSEFQQAHAILADRERRKIDELESNLSDFDDVNQWFVKSRLAFYLAGIHAAEAADRFGEAFESAPQRDLNAARMWLSTLVLRQEPMLSNHARVISFFMGFRSYVAGKREEARQHFEVVISEGIEDLYQAIGLHLYALCFRQGDAGIKILTDSVELSKRLELSENEVMARNSLISAHITQASELTRAGESVEAQRHLEFALTLAEENREEARSLQNKAYQVYALTEHAIAEWCLVAGTDGRSARDSRAHDALPSVLDELWQAITIADSVGLSDSAIFSINRRAGALLAAGREAEAVDELEAALDRINLLTDPKVVSRLVRTAGPLDHVSARTLARRAKRVRDKLDRWAAQLASG